MSDFGDTQVQGDDEREGSRRLSLRGNQPPAEIDGYTMIRLLGTGAYGTVWLAREDNTGRMVAIKYYPLRRGLNWSLLSREVEKLATLYTSRNIVRLLDVGWNAEPPYYVMEYVENGPLSARLVHGALEPAEAVRITQEVCHALVEAHGAGVLHCDLKPDNVLLDSQQHVRLCDFGQSRMSHERSPALGTLYYMSPEQADLESVPDARWDVYAVGALLYHMLTGHPPHRTSELQQQLEATTELKQRLALYRNAIEQAPRPADHQSVRGVDSRLARLIDQCLAVDPAKRLPNAQAILTELDHRERQKSRRPLLLLGVLGPLLLVAAMVPIFVSALQGNVQELESRLTYRALESDALSARALAGALEAELRGRLTDLEDLLAGEQMQAELKQLMQRDLASVLEESGSSQDKPLDQRPEWMRRLDQARQRADDWNRSRNHDIDTSWFMQDRFGNQLWRRPYHETVGKNWAHRDYFHGRNMEFEPGHLPDDIAPIDSPHVSLPFTSKATGQYMVALCVPIKDADENIIGVLGRTAHLADLRERLAEYIREPDSHTSTSDSVVREIALADVRTGGLLDHPWLNERTPQQLETFLPQLIISGNVLSRFQLSSEDHDGAQTGASEVLLENYEDPVGRLPEESAEPFRTEWMASMALMDHSKTPWIVIVQEQRASTLEPVGDMTRNAKRTVWTAMVTATLLMAIIWGFVGRAISLSGRRKDATAG